MDAKHVEQEQETSVTQTESSGIKESTESGATKFKFYHRFKLCQCVMCGIRKNQFISKEYPLDNWLADIFAVPEGHPTCDAIRIGIRR